jgi:hypothetical protein
MSKLYFLKDRLLVNKKIGGGRRFDTIDYNKLFNMILDGRLREYMESTRLTRGLLALHLRCSESFIDEMINGYIPRMEWLGQGNAKINMIVKRITNKSNRGGD